MAQLTIIFPLSNISASSFTQTPFIQSSWTPVSSSVSFTASSKASRGGAGLLAGLFSTKGIAQNTANAYLSTTAITQENDFTSLLIRNTLESLSGIAGTLQQLPYIQSSWTPVSSSVSFTASSKASRGGAGLLAGLFSQKGRGQDSQHSALGYSTAVKYITTTTVTTNRTQSGVTRIQVSSTRDQTGISRIQVTVTQNQTGISSIIGSTQQTQLGVSNIYATTTQTQSGVSRIQTSSTQTQSGTSRITLRVTQTQPGVANIYATTTKTLNGRSNIRNTTTRNQSGVAKITNATLQTITGTARLTISTLITQSGRSAIQNTTTQEQTGTARITLERGADQFGVSRIQNTATQDQSGVSRIQLITTQTQSGVARVYNTYRRNLQGRTRIEDPLLLSAPLFDVREIEEPESIAGTMVFGSDAAQYEDWIAGRFNFQYGHGYSVPAVTLARPDRKQLFTAADFLRTGIYSSNVNEEGDVTPESVTIGGDSAYTSDWISGSVAEYWATISNRTNALFTQSATEILWAGDNDTDRSCLLSSVAVEVLYRPPANTRFTQTAVEVLRQVNVGWLQQEAIEALGNQITALRYALLQQCAIEVMHSIKARVRLTQIAREILKGANPNPPVNLTNIATEVLRQKTEIDTTPSFIQQMALECLRDAPNPPAVINHIALEWAVQPFPPAVVNHTAMEWVRNASSFPAWVNHSSVEIARDAAITPTFVNHIAIEILVRPEYDPTVSSLVNNPKYFY